MKSVQSLVTVFGLVAAASADYTFKNVSSSAVEYTTITTDILTTVCPEATTLTYGTKTYTATASETLTITDCPCTASYPVKPTSYAPKPTTTSEYTWITTTETVKSYTTYCPYATSIIEGNKTYTVSEATTLTVTDCPCTKTNSYPAYPTTITIGTTTTYCPAPTTITTGYTTIVISTPGSYPIPVCTTSYVPVPVSSTSAVVGTVSGTPVYSPSVVVPYPTSSPVGVTTSYGTGIPVTPTSSTPVQVTNAAALKQVGAGAFAVGIAAMLL
jgi:hypothetical protein